MTADRATRHEDELTTEELLDAWTEAMPAELIEAPQQHQGELGTPATDSYTALEKVPVAAMNAVGN